MPSRPDAVTVRSFGVDRTGRPATLWTLRSGAVEVDVTDHGATLVAVRTPDRAGFPADVVLGFDSVNGYESPDNQYFGCTTGRVCNRIAHAVFTLDGSTYHLTANDGRHHLHGGGPRSLDKVHWHGEVLARDDQPAVRFTYRSRDGEEGYPGNLDITATYTLLREGALRVDYEATTDRRTPVNLTNHAYWNLAGAGASAAELAAHDLQIDAETYTVVDAGLIPTGAFAKVAGTALDFRKPFPVGARLGELTDEPTKGYDHNFVLRPGAGLRQVAVLHHQGSGRRVTIATTEPGLQFYSGNFLGGQVGKNGKSYAKRSALCLETQHFPDSVHHAHFPSIWLEPKQVYHTTTVWTFAAE
ncbi:MAG: galactose mutarotase [Planctomycetes bacterium]|nr:galactose mutarotase [Planctomycetota bacterium]